MLGSPTSSPGTSEPRSSWRLHEALMSVVTSRSSTPQPSSGTSRRDIETGPEDSANWSLRADACTPCCGCDVCCGCVATLLYHLLCVFEVFLCPFREGQPRFEELTRLIADAKDYGALLKCAEDVDKELADHAREILVNKLKEDGLQVEDLTPCERAVNLDSIDVAADSEEEFAGTGLIRQTLEDEQKKGSPQVGTRQKTKFIVKWKDNLGNEITTTGQRTGEHVLSIYLSIYIYLSLTLPSLLSPSLCLSHRPACLVYVSHVVVTHST